MVEALTGVMPRICRKKNGQIMIECYREHLNGFARFAELAEAIVRCWRRRGGEPAPAGFMGVRKRGLSTRDASSSAPRG